MKTLKIILASVSFMVMLIGTTFIVLPSVSALATFDNPVDKKSQTNCDAFEDPTQIQGGKNDGKWWCQAKDATQPGNQAQTVRNGKTCGGSDPKYNAYTPSIDIGCRGQGNPIADAIFGIIRFLSNGVGLIVVGSIIVGGIQYTGSRGDPQSTAMAINRIRSSLYALLIYIFAYAILNYIIPAGFLK